MKNKKEVSEKSENELCLSAALLIIRSGENTKRMIREKLLRKEFSKEAIGFALEKAESAHLIDDKRLLFSYVRNLSEKKLYGPYRIKLEVQKRFDKDAFIYIEDALEEADFFEGAKKLYDKNRSKDKEFIIRKLSRHGFNKEHIKYALYESSDG